MKIKNRVLDALERHGVLDCRIREEWVPVSDITFSFIEAPPEALLKELRSLFPEDCRLHFEAFDRSSSLRSADSLGPQREESQSEDARPATTCVLSPLLVIEAEIINRCLGHRMSDEDAIRVAHFVNLRWQERLAELGLKVER